MPETIAADRAAAVSSQPVLIARLTTRLTEDVDRRLRLTAVLQATNLGEFLDQLLSRTLPTYADLAAQLNGVTTDEC